MFYPFIDTTDYIISSLKIIAKLFFSETFFHNYNHGQKISFPTLQDLLISTKMLLSQKNSFV